MPDPGGRPSVGDVTTRPHPRDHHGPPGRRRPAVGPPRWVNRLVVRILRSPLHPLLGRALAPVTVNGRRTGRPVTVPVMYARRGGDLIVLVGHAPRKSWWRNLGDSADVTVTLQGRQQGMRATVLEAETERAEALRAYRERFPRAKGRLAATDVLVRMSPHDRPATEASR
jgi:deazaflavin-dependent oxidoreductase (nitroreductase family)